MEELAAGDVDVASALALTSQLGRLLFDELMTSEQQKRFLPRVSRGQSVPPRDLSSRSGFDVGLALPSPDARRSDGGATAVKQGNGDWLVNGSIPFVPNAPVAKLFRDRRQDRRGQDRKRRAHDTARAEGHERLCRERAGESHRRQERKRRGGDPLAPRDRSGGDFQGLPHPGGERARQGRTERACERRAQRAQRDTHRGNQSGPWPRGLRDRRRLRKNPHPGRTAHHRAPGDRNDPRRSHDQARSRAQHGVESGVGVRASGSGRRSQHRRSCRCTRSRAFTRPKR